MERPEPAASSDRFRFLRSLAFFAFFLLYFAVGIDVRLLYHGCGWVDNFPCFYTGGEFFRSFLTYPGGIVEYLSALLAQSLFHSWLGALVMTAQAWGFFVCTGYILAAFGAKRLLCLRYVVPLALIGVYCRYGFPFVPTMGLLAALLGVCLYLKLAPGTDGRAIGAFIGICLFLYVIAAGAALVFVVVCGLYESLIRRRTSLALAHVGLGAMAPYVVGGFLYGERIADAYCRLTPMSWELLSRNSFRSVVKAVWALYLLLPVAAAVLGIWRFARGSVSSSNKTKPPFGGWAGRLDVSTLALTIVTAAVVLLCRTPDRKNILLADYFSRRGMWEQVLDLGRRSPYQYTICHAVDRALCHVDKLGDEMFQFPQQPAALLLTDPTVQPLWQKFDTCLDLGLINQAENSLVLCTEIYGERPILLHRLATINMIKGNIGAARVYLRSLARVPFWQSVASRDLARIERDPNLAEDAEIQRWRSVMLKGDSVRDIDTLTVLLMENPANRMAYQCGVAFMLLSKDLSGFARMFSSYQQRNFTRIPRLYEQAIALAQTLGTWPADVPAPTVSPEVKTQLDEFLRLFRQGGGASVQSSLKQKFGDTYFYYYYMSRPGDRS
jgi:hypothetical protein